LHECSKRKEVLFESWPFNGETKLSAVICEQFMEGKDHKSLGFSEYHYVERNTAKAPGSSGHNLSMNSYSGLNLDLSRIFSSINCS
jgi:hypothetical protein